MMQSTIPSRPFRKVAVRSLAAAGLAALLLPSIARAQGTPAAGALSALSGFVIDSVHNAPLAGAKVLIEGTKRSTTTSAEGKFHIDSIPVGKHRVLVAHPLLDTLGVFGAALRTGEFDFTAGETHEIDISIPGGERLAAALCTPAQRMRGPAVMLGFVKDPDTSEPATGARVELVYSVADVIGRKTSVTRQGMVDSTGLYRICGIPGDMSGKVQVFRNGVSSGEVPAEVTDGFVALRAFSVAAHQVVAEVKTDSGKVKKIVKGTARVTGKVVDKNGKPLGGARVMLQGGGTVAVSRPNGDFVLDSLPSGTQALEVRKLGYAAADVPVELSSAAPAKANVTLGDFVPVLAAMRVEAAQDQALSKIGYLERKQMALGRFYDGKQINHEAMSFSDVVRIDPGLKVSPAGDGRTYVIQDARTPANGCVEFWVDGTHWTTMTPGDIDQYVRPDELVALEVYHGGQTPPQFTTPGQSSCATVVAWTVAKVRPADNSKKK